MKNLLNKFNHVAELQHPRHLMTLSRDEWELVRLSMWMAIALPDLIDPDAYAVLLNEFEQENQSRVTAKKV